MVKKLICFLFPLFFLPAVFTEAQYVRPVKTKMVWDFIHGKEDNRNVEKGFIHDSLDVISPTWFYIDSAYGEVASFADREYVKWAHDRGLKVWPVFENSSNNALTFFALSDKKNRGRIVEQILEYVSWYDLDGININFEALRGETGIYYEQLIVELYERLKPFGITLSVDIPLPVNSILGVYDLHLIAGNSDFIVIMGYDQHNNDSPIIGPVAAIDWVKKGIEDTLQYVSPDKVILGIPFYTRVWLENRTGGRQPASELRGMKEAFEVFENAARIWRRESITEQIYAEYSNGETTFKVWLEDEHSISLKLDLINDYDLAGMSAWRRGWEWEETWDMIEAYFQ